MIIEMEAYAVEELIQAVVAEVKEHGFDVQINHGEEKTIIGVFGADTANLDTAAFEVMDGVARVVRIQKPYKRASREFRPQGTIIDLGNGVKIGGNEVIIMAGPCAVESKDQLFKCAEMVALLGGKVLRGGAFKPRTSPIAFRGLGEQGLVYLREAADRFRLKVVTEVMDISNIPLVTQYADLVQIGARNSQNFPLLEAVGTCGKPVLLKRGAGNTIEEWLCSAEWVLHGNGGSNVILCERGIRTFETITRSTLDLSAVPVARRLSHLPIIVDPSHAAGNFRYVADLARAAVAVGADGLEIEIHPDPKKALCDGPQALTFSDFSRLMGELEAIAKAIGRSI
jgi:3-deoxy-7-phosphoheptulonate synthase